MPTIEVIALGGTIAMALDADVSGVVPALTADDLLKAVPGLEKTANIHTKTLATVGSANLTFSIFRELLAYIAYSDADGFVVTQGTDSMEETSFLASLFWNAPKPLVFTGAMRNPTTPGADGPANLADAVRVASSGKAGVYLVMNGEIHDPCRVRKSHTSSLAAFVSDSGSLGELTEGLAHFTHSLTRFTVGSLPESLPPVAHVTAVIDDDGRMLDGIIASGYKGLIVDGFGGGHVSEIWADKLEVIAEHMPVILSARTGAGRVLTSTYGYKGAEIDMINRGLITSGRLNGLQARLFLQAILAGGYDYRQVFTEFADLV